MPVSLKMTSMDTDMDASARMSIADLMRSLQPRTGGEGGGGYGHGGADQAQKLVSCLEGRW